MYNITGKKTNLKSNKISKISKANVSYVRAHLASSVIVVIAFRHR